MVLFARHALQRMSGRKISQEEVKNVLKFPDKLTPQDNGVFLAKKLRGEYLLIVAHKLVYTDYAIIIVVLTVYLTSKLKKYFYGA